MAVNRGELEREPRPSSRSRSAAETDRTPDPGAPVPSAPDPFVGKSAAVAEFLGRLDRAAASESTVLITGESGSGKSRAALRLHRASPRASGPFVGASLVATSSTLVEATLFGHERGAFTDAHKSRAGLFRRASGGTILLDDVEHLPLDVQVKLLRVLQERVIEPLGSEESIPVDVRVVATAGEPLERAVEEGRFRQDLYYRLAVLPLEVPPLRARREDLADLAAELIGVVAGRVGVVPRPLSEGALARLAEHGWPGNVRELENALERVLVLGLVPRGAEPPAIEADELDFLAEDVPGAVDELARTALALGLSIDALARAMMERALTEQRGNVSAAARMVGLTRRAFDYRMMRPEGADPGDPGQKDGP